MKALSRLLLLAMLIASLGLVGCADDGDDGDPGPAGPAGPAGATGATGATGPAGAPGTSAVSNLPPVETCYMCHETGKIAAAATPHTVAVAALPTIAANACTECHGTYATYHGNVPLAVPNCVVCHAAGPNPPAFLPLIHGIHNSHNMPSGHYTVGTEVFSVTYPSFMGNCSVCHITDAVPETTDLAAVNAEPLSFTYCMSCHENWTSFDNGTGIFGGVNHNGFTAVTNCAACHGAGISNRVEVVDFHNGIQTERAGVIWNGRDTSVDEGAKVAMAITGVSYVDVNPAGDGINESLRVTWTATYDADGPGAGAPVAVNPCNAVPTAGNPAFHAATADATTGRAAGNFSLLRAYGEGDDWTNNGIGTSPGQPVSTNLSTTNTSCAANVATTTIALTAEERATTATNGIVALQGKAQLDLGAIYAGFDGNLTTAGNQGIDQVRSKTPTYQFVVGTGAADTARRAIADTSACLKCHVGTLYQHGGNRVDNLDLCVMCHNEASSEQNVRLLDGVDATEAYDGQVGQTYGFKSFLHAVHSTGSVVNPNKITMIYRTNGVFVWAPEGVTPPNWPGTGNQIVYGSNNVTRNHNLHSPTYPRLLNDCAACHVPGFAMVPDQAVSVATTTNAGTVALSSATPPTAANLINGNGNDDTLEGTGAAACTSCHQTIKAHAYQNGWAPAVFPAGRQTIINNAP